MSLYPIASYDNEPFAEDKHLRFMAVLKDHSENQTHPIPEWTLLETMEVKESQCICTQPILNQYFISNDTTKTTLIIGSDCMKRFLEPSLHCKECGCGITTGIVERIQKKDFLCKQCKAQKKKEALLRAEKEAKETQRKLLEEAKQEAKKQQMGNWILFWYGRYYQKPFKMVLQDEAYVEYLLNLPEEKKTETIKSFTTYVSFFYDVVDTEVEC